MQMLVYTFPKLSPWDHYFISYTKYITLHYYTLHYYIVTPNIVNHKDYNVEKSPFLPHRLPTLIKEYKGVHNHSTEQRLQIDCVKSVTATLTSKEGSPPYSLVGSWTAINTKITDVQT